MKYLYSSINPRLRVWSIVPALVLVLLISSLSVYSAVESDNDKKVRAAFDLRVDEIERQMQDEAVRYEDLVKTMGTFFNASGDVGPEEFQEFVKGLSIENAYPGIKSIGYVQKVQKSEQQIFTEKAQNLNIAFGVPPVTSEGENAVLVYSNSIIEGAYTGSDVYLLPGAREALEKSSLDNILVSSVPMEYKFDGKKKLGYVLAYPVKDGTPIELTSSKRGANSGWILAAIDSHTLWSSLSSIIGMNLTVTDVDSERSSFLLAGDIVKNYNSQFTFNIGARQRHVLINASPSFIGSSHDEGRAFRYAFIISNLELIAILIGLLAIMHRVRRRRETSLTFHAGHDSLTGLPNRFYLENWLENRVNAPGKKNQKFAVLFIDLDGFKAINDTLGHQMGDEFLIAISKRLQKEVRGRDVLARIGGDEFIVVLDEVVDEVSAMRIAQRLIEVVRYPVALDSGPVCASASIGIAISQLESNTDSASVIRFADAAMYAAKKNKEERIRIFDNKLKSVVDGRHEVESSIKGAASRAEILNVLQPLIDTNSCKTYGYESLCRWTHPAFGMLSPDQFLEAAQVTGEIIEIDRWMVRQAFQNAIDISNVHGRGTRIWVNLSIRHLLQGEFYQYVINALKESDATSDMLGVEIEESVFKMDDGLLYPFVNQMKDLGIAVALDDFGSEEASLQSLKKYSYDVIKLDRSLIKEFASSPSTSIVPAVVELAKSKDMTVVATGVETPDVLQAVIDVGCHVVQGYVFSEPKEIADLVDQESNFKWQLPLGVKKSRDGSSSGLTIHTSTKSDAKEA